MDKVRIGIVGTGYIGNVHGGIYARQERAEVAALFDIIPERAEAMPVYRLTLGSAVNNPHLHL